MKTDRIEYILEHLNDPEKIMDPEFVDWLSQDDNGRIFEEVREYREAFLRKYQEKDIDVEAELRRFTRRTQRHIVRLSVRWAVAACLLVGLSSLIFLLDRSEQTASLAVVQEVPAGRKAAELILADGRRIDLRDRAQQIKEGDEDIAQNSSSYVLSYRRGKQVANPEEQVWHTLKIPARADYFVKLSDGTKVWLNCESELKYPVDFTADNREVFLEGEAYFEVQKAKEWPFIVNTEKMRIQVTGTKFGVKSYASALFVHTTLVEGVVNVNRQLLKPSEQFLLDKETGISTVKVVDTELFTGWVKGMFVFRSQRLEEVMNNLAKWYDVTVIYQDAAVKDIRFSGNLDRYDSIDDVLEIIRKLEKVNVQRLGRTIIICSK